MTRHGRGAWLADWWVRCYTHGLATDVRAERRAEIASDVHEQRAAADGRDVSAAIAGRTIRGIRADLAWRRVARGVARDVPRFAFFRAAWATITQAWFTPLAVLIFVFDMGFALSVVFDDASTMPGRVVGPAFLVGFAVLTATGLHLRRRAAGSATPTRPIDRVATPTRPVTRAIAMSVGVLLATSGLVIGLTVGGGFAVVASIAGGVALVVTSLVRSRRPSSRPVAAMAVRPGPRTAGVADTFLILGTLPALAMFWMIVPAVLAIAVICGVLGVGPTPRPASP